MAVRPGAFSSDTSRSVQSNGWPERQAQCSMSAGDGQATSRVQQCASSRVQQCARAVPATSAAAAPLSASLRAGEGILSRCLHAPFACHTPTCSCHVQRHQRVEESSGPATGKGLMVVRQHLLLRLAGADRTASRWILTAGCPWKAVQPRCRRRRAARARALRLASPGSCHWPATRASTLPVAPLRRRRQRTMMRPLPCLTRPPVHSASLPIPTASCVCAAVYSCMTHALRPSAGTRPEQRRRVDLFR
jgi:hypothetical protein